MRKTKCEHGGCGLMITDPDAHAAEHAEACDEYLIDNGSDAWPDPWCIECHGDRADRSARGHRVLDARADGESDLAASEVTWLKNEKAARKYAAAHPDSLVMRSTNNTDERGTYTYYAHPHGICDPCGVRPRSDAGNLYEGRVEVLSRGEAFQPGDLPRRRAWVLSRGVWVE